MTKVLMKGNEALAEAAVLAGCRFFSGYPITPQTEILEYLSWRMREVGGEFIQTESEIAGINMLFGAASAGARAMTTSSGPGFSLKQEGISYLAADDIPAVIVNVMRIGSGLGDIAQGQGDYWQMTRGGGHGDYRTIVLAPSSAQECVDDSLRAFELSEKYRHPVIIASDAAIGQMAEAVELPDPAVHDIDKNDWVLKARKPGEPQRNIVNTFYKTGAGKYPQYLLDKYRKIEEQEQAWEEIRTEDAEIILAAYGISARICKEAVKEGRKQGLKIGLIRPAVLWPFPVHAFQSLGTQVKGCLSVEMSILGQMADDIVLAAGSRYPVRCFGAFAALPSVKEILEHVVDMMNETAR